MAVSNNLLLQNEGNAFYNKYHNIFVSYPNGTSAVHNLLITVIEEQNVLKIKLRHTSDYCFNYFTAIDASLFDTMKDEQCLDIFFDELRAQIIEFLNTTVTKEMCVRLEMNNNKCKLIFYAKLQIKSVTLLTIELSLTNQKEIIDELVANIVLLKEANSALSGQISKMKFDLQEKNNKLKESNEINDLIQKRFIQQLDSVAKIFNATLTKHREKITNVLLKLNLNLDNLFVKLDVIKTENKLKCASTARIVQSMQDLQIENEKRCDSIEKLNSKIDSLNKTVASAEWKCGELDQRIAKKDEEIEELKKHNAELRVDNQRATVIIAQKTKNSDELGNDLIKANQMIISYNHYYDGVVEERDKLQEIIREKEAVIKQQEESLSNITADFQTYCKQFNVDDIRKMNHDLLKAQQKIEELLKCNREVTTLNTLLSKKLSATGLLDGENGTTAAYHK